MTAPKESKAPEPRPPSADQTTGETPVPQDLDRSTRLPDQIRGVTTEHALPPRLEDEGQAGG